MAKYLSYAKTYIISHIKLFLLYAETPKEFEKIAEFLIESKQNLYISIINDINKDKTIMDLVNDVYASKLTLEEKKELVLNRLKEEYSTVLEICENIIKGGILSKEDEPLDDLFA